MGVRICLTGRVRVDADGAPSDGGLGRLGALALAYLATERHRPASHDELAEVLWGDELPGSWQTSLRGIISRLRAVFAAAGLAPIAVLTSSHGCYQLHLPDDAVVDVEAAMASVEEAEEQLREGRPEVAIEAATAAADVAAAQFAPGARGLWAEKRQTELRDLHVRALDVLAEACSVSGRYQAAVRAAEEAVTLEPLREPAYRRLMGVHAAAGNRGEALGAYERCRRVLAEELGVTPSASTESLYLSLIQDEAPPHEAAAGSRRPDAPRSRLPATSFVGGEERVGQVKRLLDGSRLVTLTGPGGAGKSRLALEAATELAGSYPGGVHLAELAALSDPDLLPQHLLSASGLPEEAGRAAERTLADHLGGQARLLVLDNCEHLVGACAELADLLLRCCPDLRVLATSREVLGVHGETRWPVPALSTPDAATIALDGVVTTEAARLFLDRARSARPGFDVDEADALALAQLCRRLDGLPLALELAAGRAGVLSLAEMAARLDDRFGLLAAGPRQAPPRHRSLRAALDWSHESLSEKQRALFARLSVFWAGLTIDAAEWVGTGTGTVEAGDVLELLADLVDRSLITVEHRGGTTRYRMLETVRQYGRERLAEAPEQLEDALTLHLEWATHLAEAAGARLTGPEQGDWLRRLDDAHDDLQAGLRWALAATGPPSPGPSMALRLAAALGRYWELRGQLGQGRQWLETALGQVTQAPPLLRARALTAAAILAQGQGDYDQARSLYQEALVICRAAGDRGAMATVLHGLGNVAALQGDLGEARGLYEETLAVARQLGDDGAVAASLTNIGAVAHNQGDLHTARYYFEQSLELVRRQGDQDRTALVVGNLGYLAFQEGDYPAARSLYEESLSARRDLGDAQGTVSALCNLGYLALVEGDHDEARRSLEESLALARETGDRYWTMLSLLRLARVFRAQRQPDQASALDREAMALVSGLGAKRAIAEWLEGMASTAVDSGAFHRAVRLLGAADSLRQGIGAPLPPRDVAAHRDQLARARQEVSDAAFHDAWEAGQAMALEAALEYAAET